MRRFEKLDWTMSPPSSVYKYPKLLISNYKTCIYSSKIWALPTTRLQSMGGVHKDGPEGQRRCAYQAPQKGWQIQSWRYLDCPDLPNRKRWYRLYDDHQFLRQRPKTTKNLQNVSGADQTNWGKKTLHYLILACPKKPTVNTLFHNIAILLSINIALAILFFSIAEFHCTILQYFFFQFCTEILEFSHCTKFFFNFDEFVKNSRSISTNSTSVQQIWQK